MKMDNVIKYVNKEEQVKPNNEIGWVRGYGFVRKEDIEELNKKEELRANCPIKLTWDEARGCAQIPEEKKKAIKEWIESIT